MSFPKQMARTLDGKPDTTIVNNEAEERLAKTKGFSDDLNADGVPDAPAGADYPRMLHGVDAAGNPMEKIVANEAEEKTARANGWGSTPKQDHGPVNPTPEANPV